MSKEKQPVEIVVAEFNTDAAASAALKALKGQLPVQEAAISRTENGRVKVKETRERKGQRAYLRVIGLQADFSILDHRNIMSLSVL